MYGEGGGRNRPQESEEHPQRTPQKALFEHASSSTVPNPVGFADTLVGAWPAEPVVKSPEAAFVGVHRAAAAAEEVGPRRWSVIRQRGGGRQAYNVHQALIITANSFASLVSFTATRWRPTNAQCTPNINYSSESVRIVGPFFGGAVAADKRTMCTKHQL